MLGPIFVFTILALICLGALLRPAVGVIGYYVFVLLMPEWNWRWSIPQDLQYQKFIAVSTALGVLLTAFRGNRWNQKALVAAAALLSFLALAFLSMQSSISPTASAFYMDGIWKIVLMAVLAAHVLDAPALFPVALWSTALAQAYNAYQINESYFKLGFSLFARGSQWGYKGDNNLYSIMTVPMIAVTGSLMLHAKPVWMKVFAGLLFVLQLHQIMLLESRGCMLGGLAMVPFLLLFMPRTFWNMFAVVVAFAAGGALAGPSVVEEFSSSFAGEGERDSSAESRLDLWKAGYRIMLDYPVLGVGPYAGQNLVPKYMGLPGNQKGLHNLFTEVGTGCGIPALLLYLLFFAVAWWVAFRALWNERQEPLPDWARATYVAVVAGLAGYFVSSMFSSGALLESSYMLAGFGLAASLILARQRQRDRLNVQIPDYGNSAFLNESGEDPFAGVTRARGSDDIRKMNGVTYIAPDYRDEGR